MLTGIPLDEGVEAGPLWSDKLAPLDAQVFRKLGLAVSVEDTPCGQYLLGLDLNFSPGDPIAEMVRRQWEAASARFAGAARGRVEILVEGAWRDGIFRSVELGCLLSSPGVTCINALDRELLPRSAEDAFLTLRRWNLERSRRYLEFLDKAPDGTPGERAAALDDHREAHLGFEQDFFEILGPSRALPDLAPAILSTTDRTRAVGAWKYSRVWREFVQRETMAQAPKDASPD